MLDRYLIRGILGFIVLSLSLMVYKYQEGWGLDVIMSVIYFSKNSIFQLILLYYIWDKVFKRAIIPEIIACFVLLGVLIFYEGLSVGLNQTQYYGMLKSSEFIFGLIAVVSIVYGILKSSKS